MTTRHVLTRQNRSYRLLLDRLASDNRLTLVVGAGASMDSGLPSWTQLVRRFLELALSGPASQDQISTKVKDLAATIMDSQDTLAAATIGRLFSGEQRDRLLQAALYEALSSPPPVGRIGQAIADLATIYGSRLRILTTNYDDNIERAILNRGVGVHIQVVSDQGLVDVYQEGPSDSRVQVIHLHGYAAFNGEPAGTLVLDEKDFAISKVRPPGQILPDLLQVDEPVLFVGLSLTDPNLVAACHLVEASREPEAANPPWFGLFVGESHNKDLQRIVHDRVRAMGIQPLQLASYGQISQTLYELVHRVGLAEDYWQANNSYGRRLTQWRGELMRMYPCAQGGDTFSTEHSALCDAMSALVDEMQDTVLLDPDEDENFAVHLWVRHPTEQALGRLEYWGSSAHVHREAWTLSSQSMD